MAFTGVAIHYLLCCSRLVACICCTLTVGGDVEDLRDTLADVGVDDGVEEEVHREVDGLEDIGDRLEQVKYLTIKGFTVKYNHAVCTSMYFFI